MSKPGYHLQKIDKGILGDFSKIREELEEAMDAQAQDCVIMELVELSDMYGAIEAYLQHRYNMTMNDLKIMSDITKRAFKNGRR